MTLHCAILPSSESYDIEIHSGSAWMQAEYISSLASRCAILTDSIVHELYGKKLLHSLKSSGVDTQLFHFPHGEAHKTRATKEILENQLLENGFNRDTCIITFGGGVVTDLGGFLASTYCRGVPLVMIPTTLLGMVDASIGGKNGVNSHGVKNAIGTLYQPKKVIIDPLLLHTLPRKEFLNGFAEMIKHGLVADPHYLQYLEEHSNDILKLDERILRIALYESCRIKKEIVEKDAQEKDIRHILNFGHTVGHALEKCSQYTLSHGEAVSFGLLTESALSVQLGYLSQSDFERIQNILMQYGLHIPFPQHIPVKSLIEAMYSDKKALHNTLRLILLQGIGKPLHSKGNFCIPVHEELLLNSLQESILCCAQ